MRVSVRVTAVLGVLAGAAQSVAARELAAPAALDPTGPRLAATGAPPETVFQYATQRCDPLHIPDSPARALRTAEGVTLMAAHYTNIALLGRDFASLAPACNTGGRGAELPEPEAFDDRFWVQAVAPLPDGRVLGLASHEYRGDRHTGRCDAPARARGARCWYSSITATVAEPGAWHFRPLPLPERVVAAPPTAFDPVAPRGTGFFTTTNIAFDGDFAYVLVSTEGIAGQGRGMCLLRAPKGNLISGWRALAGGEFRLDLAARLPSRAPERSCDLVGKDVFRGTVRSLLRLRGGSWIAVFDSRMHDAASGEVREGVFSSSSPDLLRWSPPTLVWAMTRFRAQPESGLYYLYPSLIDHASPSPVFDTVGDGAAHLYLTRFNLLEDRRRGMDRDLVRVPVAVVR